MTEFIHLPSPHRYLSLNPVSDSECESLSACRILKLTFFLKKKKAGLFPPSDTARTAEMISGIRWTPFSFTGGHSFVIKLLTLLTLYCL